MLSSSMMLYLSINITGVHICMYEPLIHMFTNPVPVDIVNSLSENKSHCFSGVNKGYNLYELCVLSSMSRFHRKSLFQ
jgi:hypothetical protein